jgi:regulator of RNase E activity RraB
MAEWISYESADAPPAEISIDVDFDEDDEFRETHPHAAIVTVSGFRAGGDGQPDDQTADALYELESGIEAALNASGGALVCTVTEGAKFTLYGYVEEASNLEMLRSVSQPALKIDIRGERDDAWKFYDEYILRGEELEEARDAEQLEQLEEAGADLDAPVVVSFYIEFPSNDRLRDALPPLQKAGYTVPEISAEFFSDEGVTVAREIVLTLENLMSERTKINAIVAPFEGQYDGWGVDEDVVEEPV